MIKIISIFIIATFHFMFLTSCLPPEGSSVSHNGDPIEFSSDQVIQAEGNNVYIACFFGENDHDQVVESDCRAKLEACKSTYGSKYCHRLDNPTQDRLSRMRNEGLLVVVTHSTPELDPSQAGPSGVGVWDSSLTPSQIAGSTTAPVIWHGCYGAGIGETCPNVIPLQDTPQVLDTRGEAGVEVNCRFQASVICAGEFNQTNQPYSQAQLNVCINQKISENPQCS